MNRNLITIILALGLLGSANSAQLPEAEKKGSAHVVYEAILYFADKNQANPQTTPFFIDGLMVALVQNDHPISGKLSTIKTPILKKITSYFC